MWTVLKTIMLLSYTIYIYHLYVGISIHCKCDNSNPVDLSMIMFQNVKEKANFRAQWSELGWGGRSRRGQWLGGQFAEQRENFSSPPPPHLHLSLMFYSQSGVSFLRDFVDFREKWSPVSGKLAFVQRKRPVGTSKNLVKKSFLLQTAPNRFLG